MNRYFLWTITSATILLAGVAAGTASERGTPANPSLFHLRYQCNEVAAFFSVDAAVAQRWVPADLKLSIDAQGKATGGLIILHCPVYAFLSTPESHPLQEGVNIAPGSVVHFWLMLQGPSQVLPVPGAQVTAPTQYVYNLLDLVTSPLARRVYRRAGRNAVLVDEVTLTDEGAVQTGRIVFRDGAIIAFTASTPVQLPVPLRVGGNVWAWHTAGHSLVGDDPGIDTEPLAGNASNANTTRVQFVGLLPAPPNTTQVAIDVDARTPFTEYYGVSGVVPARGTYFRPNNMVLNSGRGELAWTDYPPLPVAVPPALP